MQLSNSNVISLKLVVAGDQTVGKTSIVNVANTEEFIDGAKTTVAACFRVNMYTFDGAIVKIYVWDTSGQERFRSLTQNYFRDANIVCIVYSVDDRDSFESVTYWSNLVKTTMGEWTGTLYLIANKSDLERVVSTEDGERMADDIGAEFVEFSAKTQVAVIVGFFKEIARKASQGQRHLIEKNGLDITEEPGVGCC